MQVYNLINQMSFKATFQIILHLHSFRVIELPHQGLFAITASIYQQSGGCQNYAIPYQYPKPQPQQIQKAKISELGYVDDQFFRSKVGIVKYSDQTIILNDSVCFRLEIEAFPYMDTQKVYIQFALFIEGKYNAEQSFKGQKVDTIRFKIQQLQNGIFNYCEGEFKDPYISRVNFTLFGYLNSYKFDKYTMNFKTVSTKEKQRSKIGSFEQLVIWSKKIFQQKTNPLHIFYTNYVKNLRHGAYLIQMKLNQYLKKKRKITIKVSKHYLQSHFLKEEDINQKSFRQYLQTYIPKNIQLDQIPKEINSIKEMNFDFMQELYDQFYNENVDFKKMYDEYQQFQKEKYGERVFKSIVYIEDEGKDKKQSTFKQNKKIAKQMREKNLNLIEYPLRNEKVFQNKDEQQFIFYEVTLNEQIQPRSQQNLILKQQPSVLLNKKKSIQYSESHMLIVLCHGFQGSSYDMSLIHRWIRYNLPDANYLISKSNEDNTECDIELMGRKLADEIQNYIKNYLDEETAENIIINMVGHSMGGIIARASLKYLEKYQYHFGFFCSLSTPHLGYLNGVDGLIKVGLWALRRWKTILSLEQLSMEEAKDAKKTFLYRLSSQGHLKYFRKIILLSSFEDSYVSWHSARISTHHSSKNSLSKIQEQMINNILKDNIYNASIHRLDVNFNVKTTNLDSFIGRTAHINLIIQQSLFKIINTTLPNLFQVGQYDKKNMFM